MAIPMFERLEALRRVEHGDRRRRQNVNVFHARRTARAGPGLSRPSAIVLRHEGALQMGGVHRALTQTTARAHPMASAHIAALVRRGDIDKSVQFCTDGINIASLAFRFGFLAPGFLKHPQNLPGAFLPKPTRCSPRAWTGVWCGRASNHACSLLYGLASSNERVFERQIAFDNSNCLGEILCRRELRNSTRRHQNISRMPHGTTEKPPSITMPGTTRKQHTMHTRRGAT
jgi:hypothetical protein